MFHKYAVTLGLALGLLGVVFMPGLAPLTLGQQETPVAAKVVATIIRIDANTNMATLRTEGGKTFERHRQMTWHVGHKVICEQRWGARREFQDCQLWESTHPATSSAQGQPVPRR